MSLKNISTLIELGSDWAKVDLGDLNSFYIIGIKESKGDTDTIDPKDVKSLSFEVGIESGIENKYLTIGYLNLNFDDFTSNDKDLNASTAMSRYLNYPSVFYIKPTQIFTANGEKFTAGITNIDININAVKLK